MVRPGLLLALSIGIAGFAGCSATSSDNNAKGGGGGGAATDGGDASAGTGAKPGDAGSETINPATTVVVIGPGADEDSPNKFGGPDDPSSPVTLAYPADGVVVPPNMNALELHFTPGAGQNLFEIRFESPAIALVAYVGCNPVSSGCAYATPPEFWSQLVEPNRGTPPVQYRVRGVNSSAPGAVGVSDTRTIAFSKEDIVGGLYYWNTAGIIQRYDFGIPYAQAELFMTPQMAGALTCVGCHGLSRDGSRMAIGADIPAPAPYKIYDVATKMPLTSEAGVVGGSANFFSFNPNGTKLLISDGVKTGVQDVATGAIDNPTLLANGTQPDWSPDGTLIAYAKGTPPPFGFPNPGVFSAGIEVVSYQNGTLGTPNVLVPFGGQNNYYPAFAPSQKWIAFNRSPSNTDSFSAGPPSGDGELWAANVESGATIRLDTANQGGSCSWPKWAPDVNTYYGGTIMYLTVSSARPYGLRLSAGQQVQLWMVGFDPQKGAQGVDPSLPAFWFPFQDLAGGNHIAQWVTAVARKPCTKVEDCEGTEDCVEGKCVPVVK